jgi:hypothetical protein
MRVSPFLLIAFLMVIPLNSCRQKEIKSDMNILYLHHSTGGVIWQGNKPSIVTRAIRKVSSDMADALGGKAVLPSLFEKYNKANGKDYLIREMSFPKASPYGWNNYPFDYYNIWVRNQGNQPYMEEPTLEMLTRDYQVVLFKHCFPVSSIKADQDSADINSDYKSIANYKLQYNALRAKLLEFPETKFIVWTGAVQTKARLTEEEALRTKEFFNWVREEWDQANDNIFLWDFYTLETEGELYLKEEYATTPEDSHPNYIFARKAADLLFDRIIDVIENNGNGTTLTGEKK